ncbi:hypothetical protein BDZ89DRAFT_1143705 [Hymenopellis radicata]|nr:hypothetical protein BDZ89DRAFT_1143705 [Hymenopellis radicata]
MGAKNDLWNHFYRGQKQNSSQYRAHCLACINAARPNDIPIDVDGPVNVEAEAWFKDALQSMAKKGSVLGVKSAMIHHIDICPNTSAAVKKQARKEKKGKGKHQHSEDEGMEADIEAEGSGAPAKKKRKRLADVKTLTQTELKVFKGINIPFSADRHPDSGYPSPVWMSHGVGSSPVCTADEVIPERRQLSGRILDDLCQTVDEATKSWLHGAYVSISSDGWKDNTRNQLTGVL